MLLSTGHIGGGGMVAFGPGLVEFSLSLVTTRRCAASLTLPE